MNDAYNVINQTEEQISNRKWYALYTRPRFEKKVYKELQEKQIESYLPLNRVLRQWSDRKKWVEEPLFRSYVFIHADKSERYRAVQAHGALRILHFNGMPAVVQDEEILIIRRLLREAEELEAADYFTPGQSVQIIRGPLIGLKGIVAEAHGKSRMIVRIDSVQQALRFSIDPADLKGIQNE